MFRSTWKGQVVVYYLLKVSDDVEVLLDVFAVVRQIRRIQVFITS